MSALKRQRVTGLKIVTTGNSHTPSALYNERAERAVLGAVLQQPTIFPSLSHLLQAGDFWSVVYGFIWHAFDGLSAAGCTIDMITVSDFLNRLPGCPLKDDALLSELASLYGAAPNIDAVEAYAQMVRDAALRLRLCVAADKIKETALKQELQSEAVKDESNRLLFEATEQSVTIATDASAMMQRFVDSFESGEAGARIPTGIAALDGLLRGIYKGEVLVLAGGEGMGKTTAQLSILRRVARDYQTAAFIMEMDYSEVSAALIGMETGISRAEIQEKRLSNIQWQRVIQAAGVVGALKLDVMDMNEFPALTPLQLQRKLRALMTRAPVEIVIIDGLWLMEHHETFKERRDAVHHITRDLSNIAKAFNVAIVITHQYNADVRKLDRPTIYHLAESAAVRRNAQVIVGLHSQSFFDGVREDDVFAFLLKNRNRNTGIGTSVPLSFDPDYARFGG